MEKNQTHIFMPASMKFSQYAITLKRQCEISTTVEQASVFWLVLKVLNWADRHQGKDKTCGNTSSITLRRHFRKPQNLNELFSLVLHLINLRSRPEDTNLYKLFCKKCLSNTPRAGARSCSYAAWFVRGWGNVGCKKSEYFTFKLKETHKEFTTWVSRNMVTSQQTIVCCPFVRRRVREVLTHSLRLN